MRFRAAGVSVEHKGRSLLFNVDFEAESGEFVVLTGRNGAGKSLLLKVVTNLVMPTDGSVSIEPAEGPPPALVFQEPDNQILGRTVAEDIEIGLPSCDDRGSRLQELLRLARLERERDRLCHNLSGGEKRRLTLASALASGSDMLLLDEPFTYLDYAGVVSVLGRIMDVHSRGCGVVLVTHDLERVLAHATRLVVMDGGQIIFDGRPEAGLDLLDRAGVRRPAGSIDEMTWLPERAPEGEAEADTEASRSQDFTNGCATDRPAHSREDTDPPARNRRRLGRTLLPRRGPDLPARNRRNRSRPAPPARNGISAAAGWDPRVLLLCFIVVNAAALTIKGAGLWMLLPVVVPVILLPKPQIVGPRAGRTPYALLIMAAVVLLGHSMTPSQVPESAFAFSRSGFHDGVHTLVKLAVLYGAAAVLTAMVSAGDLAHALRWALSPVHRELADRGFHMMVLSLRFLPRFFEIAAETRAAADARIQHRVPRLRGFSAAFVRNVVTEADRVALAAQSRRFFDWRGTHEFEGTRRSSYLLVGCTLYVVACALVSSGVT